MLLTTIILWIISSSLIILGFNNYIEDKDNRLRNNIKVEQIKEDYMEKINSLIQRCIDDLGISCIDPLSLEELKQRINPENFMNPHDAEKIQIANVLFAIFPKPD